MDSPRPQNITEELARANATIDGTDDDKKAEAHKRLMLFGRTPVWKPNRIIHWQEHERSGQGRGGRPRQ